jgi:hypothetical protein
MLAGFAGCVSKHVEGRHVLLAPLSCRRDSPHCVLLQDVVIQTPLVY